MTDSNATNELVSIENIDKQIQQHTKPSIKDLLKNAEIDILRNIIAPPAVLSIDGISFGTLGNFSCLTGKSKSRKTFFLSILIAAALDKTGSFQRITSEVLGSTVLHFDTEQSEFHTQIVARRVSYLLNSDVNINYRCFCLRPYDPKTRIEIIEEAIYNTPNTKLIVIDGIADLIIGYNNEDEAIKVIGKFMKWTHEKNIHIITIVHQNKGDNNAKGHLGSLILQKAETVLSIQKDGAISNVESTHSRGIEIKPMSFSIDENGIPYFVDYTPSAKTNLKEKTNPISIDIETHKKILRETFDDSAELTRTEFIPRLKLILGIYDITNGDNKCKEFLTYYRDSGLVKQEANMKPYTLNF